MVVLYFGGHSSGLWRLEKNLPLEDWSGGHMTEAPCHVCYERQRRKRTGWRVNQNIWARCLLPSLLSDVSINVVHDPGAQLLVYRLVGVFIYQTIRPCFCVRRSPKEASSRCDN